MADGLLDFFNSPTGMGLLSAVGAGLAGARRGQPLNSIGAGLLGGVQGYNQAQEQQQQQIFNQQKQKLMQSQIDENDLQAKARQQALDLANQRQGYMNTVGRVTSPIVGAAPNAFDPIKWMSMGGSAEEAQKLAGMGDWGKSEVARTIEGTDAQGNKVTYQYDKYGRPLGDGVQAYIAPVQVDTGGKVQFVKPTAGVTLGKTMTPGEAASNSVAWFNAKTGRDRLNMEQNKPEFKDGQWVTPPKDMKPGEVRAISGGQQVKDANDALSLIQQARQILPKSTGSYGGMALDQGARVFGYSTPGAQASAQLKAIGGMLTSKMPKMSGPQSDKDVAMYREMAGRVGDETLPIVERQSALDAVEEIQRRYASGQGGQPSSPAKLPATIGGYPTVSNW